MPKPSLSPADLGRLLLEVFDLEDIEVTALGAVTAKSLYAAFTDTLPPPKVEMKFRDLGWRKIWSLLCTVGLPAAAVDTTFSMLHNILPIQARVHRL
jgi:hypothetical protein